MWYDSHNRKTEHGIRAHGLKILEGEKWNLWKNVLRDQYEAVKEDIALKKMKTRKQNMKMIMDTLLLGRKERSYKKKSSKNEAEWRHGEPSEGMVKLYYDKAKIMQGLLATMSEVESRDDARVIAHHARVIAQVEAFEAQVGEWWSRRLSWNKVRQQLNMKDKEKAIRIPNENEVKKERDCK